MHFDHIGIAVENIEQYLKSVLEPVFNCKITGQIYTDELQRSKIAFVESTNGARIELIEPLGPDSPVFEIVKNKRGGLYHMCFVADNFMDDIEKCRANKFIMVSSPKPAIAFNDRKVAFFLTPSNELIELVEEIK